MAENTAAPKPARVEHKRPATRTGKTATVTATVDAKTGRVKRTVKRTDGRTIELGEV